MRNKIKMVIITAAVILYTGIIAALSACDVSDDRVYTTGCLDATESATVSTADAVVWLYFPDLADEPYESIILMGDELDEALRYLNGIEFEDANSHPEEPLTEMYVLVDEVSGYTVTYLVDSFGQIWVYIDEDCLWVGCREKKQ